MKTFRKCMGFVLSTALTLGLCGCGSSAAATESNTEAASETVKIGVLTYNSTDSEMLMFRSYLRDYLGEDYGAEYYYADTITSLEDEKAFIDQAKEIGCSGVIAFTSNGLEEIVDYCGEDLFYALQNMTPTEEEFNAVKSKPQFLGVVSPSNEAEYEAGTEIAEALMGEAADSSKTWLIFTGGAAYGNNMHAQRSNGLLDTLTASGYELTASMEELLTAQAPMAAARGKNGGEIYICPGYPAIHTENVEQALAMCEADRIASCCTLETNTDQIRAYKKKIGKEVKVGLIDCFSETTAAAVSDGDIDVLVGKHAAMVVPSFVAMMNAVSGHKELVKNNGEAYWINQNMWNAGSSEEFLQLYSDSINIYDNLYSTDELMSLMGVYNEEASLENFLTMCEGK